MDESYALRSCSKREDDLQRKVISLFYESFDISEIKFWYDGRSKYKYRLEIVRRILFYTPKNIPKLLLIHLTQNFLFYLTAISYILLLHNFFTLNIPKRSISIKLKLNMFHTSQKYYQKYYSSSEKYQSSFSKSSPSVEWRSNPAKHFSQLSVHERISTRFLRYDVPLPNHHDLRCTVATMKRANSLMLL